MTHEQIKRQVIDFLDKYEGEDIELEANVGVTEILDDEGFFKYHQNGTATLTITVNGGSSHELEM